MVVVIVVVIVVVGGVVVVVSFTTSFAASQKDDNDGEKSVGNSPEKGEHSFSLLTKRVIVCGSIIAHHDLKHNAFLFVDFPSFCIIFKMKSYQT